MFPGNEFYRGNRYKPGRIARSGFSLPLKRNPLLRFHPLSGRHFYCFERNRVSMRRLILPGDPMAIKLIAIDMDGTLLLPDHLQR